MQFAALEAHNPDRAASRRTARLMALVATTATGKVFAADDFDPYAIARKAAPRDWRAMLRTVEQVNAALGGRDQRRRRGG